MSRRWWPWWPRRSQIRAEAEKSAQAERRVYDEVVLPLRHLRAEFERMRATDSVTVALSGEMIRGRGERGTS